MLIGSLVLVQEHSHAASEGLGFAETTAALVRQDNANAGNAASRNTVKE